ncbi:hypothetical protein EVAR_899_1 [Eumeta japonica]|uniref:Uncharacterized protein n=1 Tax=Eumeta variegata TaxID=151549 RepID=A0A4C1SEK3_EUMVA|nr:hypothetical protein EVAR_899_1 [Eumeta japonica]
MTYKRATGPEPAQRPYTLRLHDTFSISKDIETDMRYQLPFNGDHKRRHGRTQFGGPGTKGTVSRQGHRHASPDARIGPRGRLAGRESAVKCYPRPSFPIDRSIKAPSHRARPMRLCPAVIDKYASCAPLSLFYSDIGRRSRREIARSALSLAHSAQSERDNESCFFVRAAGVHRFIRRYHVNNKRKRPHVVDKRGLLKIGQRDKRISRFARHEFAPPSTRRRRRVHVALKLGPPIVLLSRTSPRVARACRFGFRGVRRMGCEINVFFE